MSNTPRCVSRSRPGGVDGLPLAAAGGGGRPNARTPQPRRDAYHRCVGTPAQCGFLPDGVSPWLPAESGLPPAVAAQNADQDSMLAPLPQVVRLRRSMKSLRTGSLALLEALPPGVLALSAQRHHRAGQPWGELATVRYNRRGPGRHRTGRWGRSRTTWFPDCGGGAGGTVVPRGSWVMAGARTGHWTHPDS